MTEIPHDAWALLALVLTGGGVGLRLLYGAFTAFLGRVGDSVVKAAGDLSATMQKIEAILHQHEQAAVERDKDKSSELHELEARLRAEIHAAIRDDGGRTRDAIKNLRLDILKSRSAESIEAAIKDVLSDSTPDVLEVVKNG